MPEVISVNISREKGIAKVPVIERELIQGVGLANDAHSNSGHRQVSLLALEDMGGFKPGDFAENITTSQLNTDALKIGDILKIGDAVLLRITQRGKKCHSFCEIFKKTGDCIMPRKGLFAEVLVGGDVKAGDKIQIAEKQK